MSKYRIRPGYCLHLPNHAFAHPGEEVDLSGDLEQEVLGNQGWKVYPAPSEPDLDLPKVSGPEAQEVDKPPKDRAIKKAKVDTR